MTLQSFYNRYKRESIMATPPEELVSLLFDRALKHFHDARHALEEGNVPVFGLSLRKGQAIVAELKTSLDLEAGGDIAANLERLYGYVIQRLTKTAMDRDGDGLQETIDILEKIKEGWSHAVVQDNE